MRTPIEIGFIVQKRVYYVHDDPAVMEEGRLELWHVKKYGPFATPLQAARSSTTIKAWLTRKGYSRCADGVYRNNRFDTIITIKEEEARQVSA